LGLEYLILTALIKGVEKRIVFNAESSGEKAKVRREIFKPIASAVLPFSSGILSG
jgi:hypothetical protein